MRHFTRQEIVEGIAKQRASFRKAVPAPEWFEEVDAFLVELSELAADSHSSEDRLIDLERRLQAFIRSRKFKGLTPLQWMIDSLKTEGVEYRKT
jgi:hypothetical protein